MRHGGPRGTPSTQATLRRTSWSHLITWRGEKEGAGVENSEWERRSSSLSADSLLYTKQTAMLCKLIYYIQRGTGREWGSEQPQHFCQDRALLTTHWQAVRHSDMDHKSSPDGGTRLYTYSFCTKPLPAALMPLGPLQCHPPHCWVSGHSRRPLPKGSRAVSSSCGHCPLQKDWLCAAPVIYCPFSQDRKGVTAPRAATQLRAMMACPSSHGADPE